MPDAIARTIRVTHDFLKGSRLAPRVVPDVSEESSFEHDLRCDPIDMVCIMLAIEDEFEIEFPSEKSDLCETVGDLARLAESLIGKVAA